MDRRVARAQPGRLYALARRLLVLQQTVGLFWAAEFTSTDRLARLFCGFVSFLECIKGAMPLPIFATRVLVSTFTIIAVRTRSKMYPGFLYRPVLIHTIGGHRMSPLIRACSSITPHAVLDTMI